MPIIKTIPVRACDQSMLRGLGSSDHRYNLSEGGAVRVRFPNDSQYFTRGCGIDHGFLCLDHLCEML